MQNGVVNKRQLLYFDEVFLNQAFQEFIDQLFSNRRNEEVKYISEKTPSNLLVATELLKFNPNFKILIVVRDPRGVIASMKEVKKRANKNGQNVAVGSNLLLDLKLINNYLRKADILLSQHQFKVQFVYYEELLEHPEREIRSICEYLNVDFFHEMLDTSLSNEMSELASNPTISAWRSKDLYDSPISSENAKKWQHMLSKWEANLIESYFTNHKFMVLEKYKLNNNQILPKVYLKLLGYKTRLKIIFNSFFNSLK
jgi:hypothetical protein